MKEIAIEGLDGSGKTTLSYALAAHFEHSGQHARVVSPYREANQQVGHDLYEDWHDEERGASALMTLKEVIETQTSQAEHDNIDVLIFDRHWMTVFSEISENNELIELWGDTFVPTAYLRVNPDLARERANNDQDAVWMAPETYELYRLKYEALCRNFGKTMLGIYRNDSDVTIDMLVRNIQWDMNIRR